MNRQRVGVASFISLICAGAVACGGSQSGAKSEPIGNASNGTGAAVAVAPTYAVNTAIDGHKLLPPSASVYLGVDFARLSSATVLEPYKKRLTDQMPGEFAALQARCGIDLMSDFDWLLAALVPDSDQAVVMLKGNFTQSAIEACIEGGNDGADQVTMTTEGPLRVYEQGGDRTYVAWLTDSVVLMSDDKGRALLDESLARGDAKVADPSVASELSLVDTGAAMWFTAQVSPTMSGGLPVQDVSSVRLSVETDSTVDVVFAADFLSSDKAAKTHNELITGIAAIRTQPMVQPFLSILDKLKIAQTDRVVSGNLNLTSDDLVTIESALSMLGVMP